MEEEAANIRGRAANCTWSLAVKYDFFHEANGVSLFNVISTEIAKGCKLDVCFSKDVEKKKK